MGGGKESKGPPTLGLAFQRLQGKWKEVGVDLGAVSRGTLDNPHLMPQLIAASIEISLLEFSKHVFFPAVAPFSAGSQGGFLSQALPFKGFRESGGR